MILLMLCPQCTMEICCIFRLSDNMTRNIIIESISHDKLVQGKYPRSQLAFVWVKIWYCFLSARNDVQHPFAAVKSFSNSIFIHSSFFMINILFYLGLMQFFTLSWFMNIKIPSRYKIRKSIVINVLRAFILFGRFDLMEQEPVAIMFRSL